MTTNGNGRFAGIFYTVLIGRVAAQWFAIASLFYILLPLSGALPMQTDDRYRRSNAEGDFRLRDEQIRNLDTRLTAVENRQRP